MSATPSEPTPQEDKAPSFERVEFLSSQCEGLRRVLWQLVAQLPNSDMRDCMREELRDIQRSGPRDWWVVIGPWGAPDGGLHEHKAAAQEAAHKQGYLPTQYHIKRVFETR